ncbi:alpha,alpha-trehalase TreF [Foetidibacter luteolus]|uniref:alpha,alpha-trehalase TreF n=1 Tax=Foetidibacter luteolus TaxID=2608880 RepID=UPI00129B27CD|nr:alpha,alpha-trehalase TreF [Foetidibacter luteolus]
MRDPQLLYIEDLEELFVDVQTSRLLADQKTFVDAEPKGSLKDILHCYRRERQQKDFQLAAFLKQHFSLPAGAEALDKQFCNIDEYITYLWDALTRYPCASTGTLVPLPEKFVVPGGRFREIFYWDSYFTMLGLQAAGRVDLMESMVNNFAYLINRLGFIPNANRTYLLSRSQPPFFSMMVELLAEEKGEAVWVKYLPQLQKEYAFWMKGSEELSKENRCVRRVVRMRGGEVLNRYWDELDTPRPEGYVEDLETASLAGSTHNGLFRHLRAGAESGWDYSSRWLADGHNLHSIRTTDLVALDLNCLLLHLEKSLQKASRLANDEVSELHFTTLAFIRENAIQKYLWSEELQAYTDYDFLGNKPVRAATVIMVYTLVSKLASHQQASKMAGLLQNRFLQPGGLLTTLVQCGQQWDAPNGWAPLHWMAYRGLRNYGFEQLATEVKQRWMATVENGFKQTGRLMEKYNVVNGAIAGGGEYPNQYGFGWTNGVYLKMKSSL